MTRRAAASVAPAAAATPVDAIAVAADTRALAWGLEALGWAPRAAGNIVAIAHGLRPARDGWAIREIEHLRFLRSLVRAGRIDS